MDVEVVTLAAAIGAALWLSPGGGRAQEPVLKAGIIGCDTSHAAAFTSLFNDASNPEHVPGVKVVAAYPGGSPDVEASASRVKGYTADLRDRWKVEIVEDIPALCSRVDAVLL